MNRCEEAETLLGSVRLADQDGRYREARAQLDLKRQAVRAPEIEALEAARQERPDDLDVAYQLALQYSQHQHHREAMELLVEILRQQFHGPAMGRRSTRLNPSRVRSPEARSCMQQQ